MDSQRMKPLLAFFLLVAGTVNAAEIAGKGLTDKPFEYSSPKTVNISDRIVVDLKDGDPDSITFKLPCDHQWEKSELFLAEKGRLGPITAHQSYFGDEEGNYIVVIGPEVDVCSRCQMLRVRK